MRKIRKQRFCLVMALLFALMMVTPFAPGTALAASTVSATNPTTVSTGAYQTLGPVTFSFAAGQLHSGDACTINLPANFQFLQAGGTNVMTTPDWAWSPSGASSAVYSVYGQTGGNYFAIPVTTTNANGLSNAGLTITQSVYSNQITLSVTGTVYTNTACTLELNLGNIWVENGYTGPIPLTITPVGTSTSGFSSGSVVVGTVNAPPGPVTVTAVTVSSSTYSVAKGATQQFTATVTGTNNPAQTVMWTVYGNNSTGTTISPNGLLTVAAGETATSLTVRATSTIAPTQYGEAAVTLTAPLVPGTVTGVTVLPPTASVMKGTSQTFTATVNGTNPAQTVNWYVYNNTSSGTTITSGGVLTVAANETATSLTVKAISTVDPTKSGTATVTVTAPPIAPGPVTVTGVTVSSSTYSVAKGTNQQFTATVTGTNNPDQTVMWTVYGNSSNGTTISSGGLLTIAANETATSLRVTATSTVDPTKSGTATVTVTAPGSGTGGGSSGGGGGGTTYYSVTFNTNGGSAIAKQSVANGSKLSQPTAPTKDGYTFAGWYTDQALTNQYDFTKTISGNITLYAKWTEGTAQPTPTPTPTPGQPSTGWQNPFSDIKSTDWFYGDVGYVFTNGIFNGTGATTFSPSASMTRGMFVTVLWRQAGSPAGSGSSQFTDVAQGAYYTEAVKWAAANGVVKGISNTLFAPNGLVTREQMAAILYRYQQFSGQTPSGAGAGKEFADQSKISSYAQDSVNALVKQGILSGKPNNLFDPHGTATRAEVAAVLHRFMAAVQ